MIIDHIRNAHLYYGLGIRFETALKSLSGYQGSGEAKNDIAVDCDNVFIKVRPYITKPAAECKFEAHRLYADIHFVVEGCEQIGYAEAISLHVVREDADKDMIYLEGNGDMLTLRPGFFMVAFPEDAHMPCVASGGPTFCHKLIAKVKL